MRILAAIDKKEVIKNVTAFINTQKGTYEAKIDQEIIDLGDVKTNTDRDKAAAVAPLPPDVTMISPAPAPMVFADPGKYIKDTTVTRAENGARKDAFTLVKDKYYADVKTYKADMKLHDDSQKAYDDLKDQFTIDDAAYNKEQFDFDAILVDTATNLADANQKKTDSTKRWNDENTRICKDIEQEVAEYKAETQKLLAETDLKFKFNQNTKTNTHTPFLNDPFSSEAVIENNYEFIHDSTKTLVDINEKIKDLFTTTLTPSNIQAPGAHVALKPKTLFPSMKTDRDLFHQLYDQKKGTPSKKSGIYYHFNNYQKANAIKPQSIPDYVRIHIK